MEAVSGQYGQQMGSAFEPRRDDGHKVAMAFLAGKLIKADDRQPLELGPLNGGGDATFQEALRGIGGQPLLAPDILLGRPHTGKWRTVIGSP